jgi:hypothetical protein
MTTREAIAAPSPHSAGFDLTGRLALESHCVFRDAYDEAAFRSLLDQDPRLAGCSRRGETRLRSFPALLSDVFCLLFKLRPTLIERSRVRPAFQVNRYLIARLAAEPRVASLRAGTTLDEEAAAAATVAVAERLLAELAETDLAEENRLFELEESIDPGGGARKSLAAVRRKSAAGHEARDAGTSAGPGCTPLAYDLQQRLEMAEALKNFRSFEHLLALARALVSRLTSHDPTGSQPTEVYDIGLGNELSRLLPSELLSLRASPLRRDFLRRLLGRQLLTYQITGRECGGPMVILVDVSHSMAGEKELASKALAIALSEVAAGRGQPVNAMLFGHRTAPRRRNRFREADLGGGRADLGKGRRRGADRPHLGRPVRGRREVAVPSPGAEDQAPDPDPEHRRGHRNLLGESSSFVFRSNRPLVRAGPRFSPGLDCSRGPPRGELAPSPQCVGGRAPKPGSSLISR